MKTLRNAFVAWILLLTLAGCREEMDYQTHLVFANSYADTIEVRFYPTDAYKSQGGFYPMSEMGSGYLPCETEINVDEFLRVFYSKYYDEVPSILLSRVFDSISFSVLKDPTKRIVFSKEQPDPSPGNPLISNDIWALESYEDAMPTMFHLNPVQINRYTFTLDSSVFEP
ncbi:MAG: hypothetical protein R2751_14410 [Bacteroidales bacterium]